MCDEIGDGCQVLFPMVIIKSRYCIIIIIVNGIIIIIVIRGFMSRRRFLCCSISSKSSISSGAVIATMLIGIIIVVIIIGIINVSAISSDAADEICSLLDFGGQQRHQLIGPFDQHSSIRQCILTV